MTKLKMYLMNYNFIDTDCELKRFNE